MTLALIDIESGNLHSVANALAAAGATDVTITADPDAIARADRIVLPGVGAAVFDRARPFLGICVGMQLMAETGEEMGIHRGLGWMKGRVRRLDPGTMPGTAAAKVPHMGWNDVRPAGDHPLVPTGEAYFLHSYAYDGEDIVATTDHAGPVTAAIARDTMLGVQFHPEKSQRYGLAMLATFLKWRP
jgi:imidazole glycerol-phosphate synthase subunit HisH